MACRYQKRPVGRKNEVMMGSSRRGRIISCAGFKFTVPYRPDSDCVLLTMDLLSRSMRKAIKVMQAFDMKKPSGKLSV